MPKDTYRNEAKIRSIEKQREFIERELIKRFNGNPSKLRVAFFPGREALEYEFVYKPLGILPENIVAIERDPEIHRLWKNEGTFQVGESPIEAKDFFTNYDGPPFDIISLDYDGRLNSRTIKTFQNISKRGLLNEKSVLATNFYAMRENKEQKKLFSIPLSIPSVTRDWQTIMNSRLMDSFMKRLGYEDGSYSKENTNLELEGAVLDISEEHVSALGTDNDPVRIVIDANKIQEHFEGNREIRDIRSEGILRIILGEIMKGKKDWNVSSHLFGESAKREKEAYVDEVFRRNFREGTDDPNVLRIQLNFEYFMSNQLPLLEEFLISHGYEKTLSTIFFAMEDKAYYPIEMESYSYISNDGSLMFNDLILLDQKKAMLDKYLDLYNSLFTKDFPLGPLRCVVNPNSMSSKDIRRKMAKQLKEAKKPMYKIRRNVKQVLCNPNTMSLPQREDLGSSYKQIVRSKKRLKELVAQGLSQEEIESQFRISSHIKRSLPAFIAHRTMGTYTQEEVVEIEQDPKPSSLLEEIVEEPVEFKLIPHGKRKQLTKMGRFTEGIAKRLKYFGDDISHLSESKRRELYDSVLESKWYRPILNKEISDIRVYTFFDDIMLYVKKKRKIPSSDEIKNIWHNGIKLRNYTRKKPSSKKSPEEHNEEIYNLIIKGVPDEKIMQEFDLTKRQLGARKAWVTMRQRG